jgi:hypothetical protein
MTKRTRAVIFGALVLIGLIAGSVICFWAAWWATRNLNLSLLKRTDLLVTWMVAGCGATAFLAALIEWLDRPLRNDKRSFVVRWPIECCKRIVMLGQIAAMVLALGGAITLAFGFSLEAAQTWVGR